ncbi:uncharacterized protein BDZ99DRAFT_430569 [Mytilinidion resinicola]|uniref:U6 small nuclear RNA (adenine-(43)-N(6))-methyltransferase n=1 Tax=Mytilinidion resinicola TaxID=574789 RepID=A0A6A6Z765_9PEZI|nr:uncharacterized protein BDZ99DRAFT_430569 [Mytilinidion resinicola]KAF2816896.1 hypothetical protein BDZ99DRAFT_430569 [Mytilinidion resinicola]
MAASSQIPYYQGAIDLRQLVLGHKELSSLGSKSGFVSFQDPIVVKYITIALLKRDFGLDIRLPDDRLCPRVPIRYNYVRWIQELIDTTSPKYTDTYDPARVVTGLDIGTGASAIYTILALQTRPSWHMCATDIDEQSLSFAKYNIQNNDLDSRALVTHTKPSDPLISLPILGVEGLEFTICNPPFFSTDQEFADSLAGKGKDSKPYSSSTGTPAEMVYPGGDLAFVSRIFEESLKLREKVQWYSSMFGKLTSANAFVMKLRENNISNYAVSYLWAGGATRRWAVAWSFGDLRPRHDVARHWSTERMLDPFPTVFHIPFTAAKAPKVAHVVDTYLSSLQLRWSFDPASGTGFGITSQNVWSRAFRRQQQKKTEAAETEMAEEAGEKVALAFKMFVFEEKEMLSVRWLQGADQVIWESFTGMLKRFVDGIKD